MYRIKFYESVKSEPIEGNIREIKGCKNVKDIADLISKSETFTINLNDKKAIEINLSKICYIDIEEK